MEEQVTMNYTLKEMVTLSWEMAKEEWKVNGPTTNFVAEFSHSITEISQLPMVNVSHIALVAIFFTVHRFIYTAIVVQPLGRYFNFIPKDLDKFPESCCKMMYYSIFFAYECYLVNFKYPEYIMNPRTQWQGWNQSMEIPDDIYYLYLLEAGFYFHSIFATIFMDTWRKDSVAMLLHHVLANSLILLSMLLRFHNIGLVVLYLHDVADVLLEITKVISFFKNKKSTPFLEIATAVGFISFTSAWFWCRLYLYPQVVLFSAAYLSRDTVAFTSTQYYFLFNFMLWLLYALNVYWFHFIISLIVRIATGRSKEIVDNREYENTINKEKHSNGKENGKVLSKGIHETDRDMTKTKSTFLLQTKTKNGGEYDTSRLRLRSY